MTKTKFYAVHNGKVPGVYNSWPECKAQTNGVSLVFKSFTTYEHATMFYLTGEDPASSKFYGVINEEEPEKTGVYTSWPIAKKAWSGVPGARVKSWKSLVEAKVWLINKGINAHSIPFFRGHFSQYSDSGFEPDPSADFLQEFDRLASSQGWEPSSQQYKEEKTTAMGKEMYHQIIEPAIAIAIAKEEGTELTKNDETLIGYQTLLQEVGKEPLDSINACFTELKNNTLVNIIDLINARRNDSPVRRWEIHEFGEFKRYTLQPGHTIDVNMASKDRFLRPLLQDFSAPRDSSGRPKHFNSNTRGHMREVYSNSRVRTGRIGKASRQKHASSSSMATRTQHASGAGHHSGDDHAVHTHDDDDNDQHLRRDDPLSETKVSNSNDELRAGGTSERAHNAKVKHKNNPSGTSRPARANDKVRTGRVKKEKSTQAKKATNGNAMSEWWEQIVSKIHQANNSRHALT